MPAAKELEQLQKSIRYKAEHRGSKEADALIGQFCAFFLPSASFAELILVRDLVNLDDTEAFHLLEHPPEPYTAIAQAYQSFKNNPGGIF
jgi:succinate dehydrogenase flavin-adding protein (antitoxin of CptAB toxin-antitoxin module)